MHVGHEAVGQALLLSCRDLDVVSRRGQVADDLALVIKSPEITTDKVHGDRRGLLVAERDQGLGRLAIDELDAEDLGGREGSLHRDGQLWCL